MFLLYTCAMLLTQLRAEFDDDDSAVQKVADLKTWLVNRLNHNHYHYMGVSKNRGGPPKSSILIGFSIVNHPFWGFYPYFWKHLYIMIYHYHHYHTCIRTYTIICKLCLFYHCFFRFTSILILNIEVSHDFSTTTLILWRAERADSTSLNTVLNRMPVTHPQIPVDGLRQSPKQKHISLACTY